MCVLRYLSICLVLIFSFFNDPATTEIYTLSLHDALPISCGAFRTRSSRGSISRRGASRSTAPSRSEEHTSELQSRQYLVCRLLLEKKKKNILKIMLLIKDVTGTMLVLFFTLTSLN